MNAILLITVSVLVGTASFLVVASRRHKRQTPAHALIDTTAIVEHQLTPVGTVLINGELWPAVSNDNSNISSRSLVKVVGLSGHRLLIEKLD